MANKQTNPDRLFRDVDTLIQGEQVSDGAGVNLRRYIASTELPDSDPFLLLDVFASNNPEDYIAGFPMHPHRGFETVTYLLAGRVRHKDTQGHEGIIEAGGVQWMTAGRGIQHSEMPEQQNGLLHGFQLWLNLPADKKMTAPRYQEFSDAQISREHREHGVLVRVIAGETSLMTRGPVTGTAVNPLYLDVSLAENSLFSEPVGTDQNVLVFVISGAVTIQGEQQTTRITAETLAVMGQGDTIAVTADEDSRFLLMAADPLHEPIARSGPFVMNTQEQIKQAWADYHQGRFDNVSALNKQRNT
jgi:redox-sensitive bicupin YhaK (pirin superfamily)